MSFEALWQGILMGAFACIGPKLVCAAWAGSDRWVIGMAMVGRAEFAYLIAEMGKTARMIDDKLFSVLIWALLCATILAPPMFAKTLKTHIAREEVRLSRLEADLHAEVQQEGDSKEATGEQSTKTRRCSTRVHKIDSISKKIVIFRGVFGTR